MHSRRGSVPQSNEYEAGPMITRKSLETRVRFMAQGRRFIHKLQRSRTILLVSVAFLTSMMPCELAKAADSPSPEIIGSWQVYKDDDLPDGPIPNEIINFWANGKLRISGDHPNIGLYRINRNRLEFLIKKGDRAIPVERQFELSAKELKFKNDKIGWVYYRRVSEQPEGKEPKFK